MNSTELLSLNTRCCDFRGLWKLSDILLTFQELAGKHSASLGCGRKDLYDQYGLVWVVTRYQVSILHFPVFGDQLRIVTRTAPTRRTFYPRYFQVMDEKGTPILNACSYWALCDIHTRKMVFSDRVASLIPDMTDGLKTEVLIKAFPAPECEEQLFHRTVGYADLDINGHVSNARYLDWLCDTLGVRILSEKSITSFIIDYQHEIRQDEKTDLFLRTDQNSFLLTGEVRQQSAFRIGGFFA